MILTLLPEELTIATPPRHDLWYSLARNDQANLATLEDHFNGHGRVRLRGKTICSDDPDYEIRMILQPLRHKLRSCPPNERNSLAYIVNDREGIVFWNLLDEGTFLLHVPVSQ